MGSVNSLRSPGREGRALRIVTTALLIWAGATATPAVAAPALRFQVDSRGDAVVFGNTLGFDCRSVVPKPTVGDVDTANCGMNTDDNDIDVLWRSDEPTPGRATASTSITPEMARSTAVLNLPAGALTSYARIYWSAQGPKGMVSPSTILVERPGVFMQTVAADSAAVVDVTTLGTHYQHSADITSLVQTYGPGAYRVSKVVSVSPLNQADQLLYAAWSTVVFYYQKSSPPRSLTIFDGFDEITGAAGAAARLDRFLVPNTGFDAKLSIVAYEGNPDATGDRIAVNGTLLTDPLNPPTNFFNGTHSVLGQAVTTTGDLPQTNGQIGSLSGLDIDVVDITSRVKAGDKAIDIAASTTNDSFFIGMFAGAVATLAPVFVESQIDYQNETNPGGSVRPGDKLMITVTAPNTGSDTSTDTYITVPLPPGLSYVPGTIKITNGPNSGTKTDPNNDDQAEYDPASRTIKVRVGNGGNMNKGGNVATTDTPPTIQFEVTVEQSANGMDVKLGGVITASGVTGSMQGVPPASWNTGSILTPMDGPNKGTPVFYPNRPLSIPVRECANNLDCPIAKPRCDAVSARCTNSCATDPDCHGVGIGQICTSRKQCGCVNDNDCLSKSCDAAAGQCHIPNVDLSVKVTSNPNPPQPQQPVVHIITVTNNGPDTAPPGTTVIYTVPPGGKITSIDPGPDWQCAQANRTITCTYDGPIGPSESTPKIRITVTPDPNRPTVDINTTVKTPAANDPSPDNNTVIRSDTIGGAPLPEDQLAGGGCSCNVGEGVPSRAPVASFIALLSMLALLIGRRRLGVGR